MFFFGVIGIQITLKLLIIGHNNKSKILIQLIIDQINLF